MKRLHKNKVYLVLIMLVVVLLSSFWILVALFPFLYLFWWFISVNDGKRYKIKVLAGLLFILLGTLPLLFDFRDSSQNIVFSIMSLRVTEYSLIYFLKITLRCVDSFALLNMLIYFCPVYMICHRLRKLKVPNPLVEIIELTFRYINIMEETARNIAVAQVVRGGYNGFVGKIYDLGLLFSRTLLISVNEADMVYNGSLTRLSDYDNDKFMMTDIESNNTIISLRDVCYSYVKDNLVLKDINFDLYKGEKIVFLGANGAGKSTLFSIISGIEKRISGSYSYKGVEIENSSDGMKKIRRKVSLVMQNSNHQLFTSSVEDEIAYSLRNMGLQGSVLNDEVNKIISMFRLESLRGKTPYNLSEGQKKWVAIASILAINPDVLVLDEPTSNLDVPTSKKVINLLDSLNDNGKTVIISTHDMSLARKWATRALVVNDGRIVFDGKTEDLFAMDASILEPWGICHPNI